MNKLSQFLISRYIGSSVITLVTLLFFGQKKKKKNLHQISVFLSSHPQFANDICKYINSSYIVSFISITWNVTRNDRVAQLNLYHEHVIMKYVKVPTTGKKILPYLHIFPSELVVPTTSKNIVLFA